MLTDFENSFTVRNSNKLHTKLENVAMANALQLEAGRATPALFRFNYDA